MITATTPNGTYHWRLDGLRKLLRRYPGEWYYVRRVRHYSSVYQFQRYMGEGFAVVFRQCNDGQLAIYARAVPDSKRGRAC